MELYDSTCQSVSRVVMRAYSTSFGTATQLFPKDMRPHIYNIYAMVRVADEIVDTAAHDRALELLDEYELRIYNALKDRYSTDPVAHAFQLTANQYQIDIELIRPFFASMRQDITVAKHTAASIKRYIYGSAEVVGLMCLRVFSAGDEQRYQRCAPAAQALGSAYQKINFLRDLSYDLDTLGRQYFPGLSSNNFDNPRLQNILADIQKDFYEGKEGIALLPANVRPAVNLSYEYYYRLLQKLSQQTPEQILASRTRLPDLQKILLFARAKLGALTA